MKTDPRAIVPVSLAKRLTQAVTYGLTGGFFSPQLPLQPQHPETAGRRLDYIAGYNISTKPRRDSGIDFSTLRSFSKYYDLLRILIEKRKDQITNFEWSVVPTDEAVAAAGGSLDKLAQDAAAAQKFLKFPDGRQPWGTWLRALIEDLLVLDAIVVWPTYQGNRLAKLETIDPATIKLVIDESGRMPEPPFPAYQQVLHGIPTSNFLKDELLYYISNPASDRIYGLSKVEQIIITIQIGLRRETSQLQFFTDGNVPAALAGVPETWTPQQIAMLQDTFDEMMSGDTANRRKIWFIPGEASKNIKEMKSEEATLKAAFDEWIMRIMCFAMGVAPTPFVNQVNRATAFTAQEEARDEGLGPQLTFLKSVMDSIIKNALKLDGVEFKWSMEAENDPETQATIDDKMIRNGSRSVDELRQRDGLDAIGVGPMVITGTGVIKLEDIASGKVQSLGIQPEQQPGADPNAPPGSPTKPKKPAPPGASNAQQPKPDGPMASAPYANKPKPDDKKSSSKKSGAKTTTPDGKEVTDNDHDTDEPLITGGKDKSKTKKASVAKGGSSEKLSPFRLKAKKFSYAAHAFHNPKGAAAQARLIKASQSHSESVRKARLEKAQRGA